MASSVVSARDLERWAKERAEAQQSSVPMPKVAKDSFSAMKPDFEALSKFEAKVEKFEEKRQAKQNRLQTDTVINVMGSTAGAGSGEFHTYRGFRTKELARLKDMERERKEEEAQRAWETEKAEREAALGQKTSKKAAKRQRQKDKSREEKRAKGAGAGAAAGADCSVESDIVEAAG